MPYGKIPLRFTHQQRNGIFLLMFLIIGLELLYYELQSREIPFEPDVLTQAEVQREIDSLKAQLQKETKPKIYPFNPNFINDFKGYTLGMSPAEIDKLLAYREKGLWINTKQDFQRVTGISDSLLNAISPYFKFPEWTRNRSNQQFIANRTNRALSFAEKQDLNTATASDLQIVNGVGKVLSERIIRFRDSFEGGFIHSVQLKDVYGLSEEVIDRINNRFTVKTPRQIIKVNLNKATVDQLVMVQHIDYELAHEIIKQRTLREGFKSWEELTKVKDFPQSKIEIIQLYLTLDLIY